MFLVIGLDGATFDLLEPWMAEGHLPTLARLKASGTYGVLESTLPPITAPAWASFMTGKYPGRHGIFDFFRSGSSNMELINAADVDGLTLWEILSKAGLRVGVINVPLTYPVRPVNGYILPGLLSPIDRPSPYPASLLDGYESRLGPYRKTPRVGYQAGREELFIKELFAVLDSRIAYLMQLASDRPVDFLMAHFLVTDIAQHALWKHLDPTHPWHDPQQAASYGSTILSLYTRIDQALDRLLASLPGDLTVMVMSDHGFGPLHKTVNLNNYLHEVGLLKLKEGLGVRARAAALRNRIAPSKIGHWIRPVWLRNWVQDRFNPDDWKGKWLSFKHVDWSRTIAYSKGHLGQVYLNLKDREPEGIVVSRDYHRLRSEVGECLQAIPDPTTNLPLAVQVFPREEGASGPYLNRGPDLHIVMEGYRAVAYPLFVADGKVLTEIRHFNSGDHRREGILVLAGPAIRSGTKLRGARIVDLAPTILHALGIPVPGDMEGQVLEEAFHPDFMKSRQIQYTGANRYSRTPAELPPEEQAQIENRLRSLGYLG